MDRSNPDNDEHHDRSPGEDAATTRKRMTAPLPDLERLDKNVKDMHIVVLPDVYIDVLVPFGSWRDGRRGLDLLAAQGGGNKHTRGIEIKIGGNAGNLAQQLARLGARVDLVGETDALGRAVLEQQCKHSNLSVQHVRVVDDAAATVSLECNDANLMISDPGPVENFGPSRLDEAAWRTIEEADAVAVLNWSANKQGTALLEAVAKQLEGRDTHLYLDTGDPTARSWDDRRRLLECDAWGRVDTWAMNVNELESFAVHVAGDTMDRAMHLAGRLDARIDVHDRHYAISIGRGSHARVATEGPPAKRLTGAGDAWNAGNIIGLLAGLGDSERLSIAHASANEYVLRESSTSESARHGDEGSADAAEGGMDATGGTTGLASIQEAIVKGTQ